MGALANPYVLVAVLAFAGFYATVEKVKGPVKAAYHETVKVGETVGKVVVYPFRKLFQVL